MSATAKIQHKGQVTIPTRLRNQAGLSKGDLVEFTFQRGKIVITPKLVIDRSQFQNADDEYTPRSAVSLIIAWPSPMRTSSTAGFTALLTPKRNSLRRCTRKPPNRKRPIALRDESLTS
jgi:AbrB family looped-hinge helix DNA binding protein